MLHMGDDFSRQEFLWCPTKECSNCTAKPCSIAGKEVKNKTQAPNPN